MPRSSLVGESLPSPPRLRAPRASAAGPACQPDGAKPSRAQLHSAVNEHVVSRSYRGGSRSGGPKPSHSSADVSSDVKNHHQIFGDVSTEFRLHQHRMPLPRQFATTAAAVSQPTAKTHKQEPRACSMQFRARMFPGKGKKAVRTFVPCPNVCAAQCASWACRCSASHAPRACRFCGPPARPGSRWVGLQ